MVSNRDTYYRYVRVTVILIYFTQCVETSRGISVAQLRLFVLDAVIFQNRKSIV